jgi:small nuclear ribonucleoprotein (snRNP)-like protein
MMRGDEGCQHYLTQTFEKYLGVLRGYIATMNIYLFKKKEKKEKKEKGNHICLLESGTSL